MPIVWKVFSAASKLLSPPLSYLHEIPYRRLSQPLHLFFIYNCNLNPLSLCNKFTFSFLFILCTEFQFHFQILFSTWRIAQNPRYTQKQQPLPCSSLPLALSLKTNMWMPSSLSYIGKEHKLSFSSFFVHILNIIFTLLMSLSSIWLKCLSVNT